MRLGRKASGGRYRKTRKKKARERPGQRRVVKIGERKVKKIRVRGGKQKDVSLSQKEANVVVKKGQTKKVLIKDVLETPSNRFLARQDILVKGAIIETELGKARITNRPSQEGCVQAVIIQD